MNTLDEYLTDLEERIDEEQEDKILEQWKSFAEGNCKEQYFSPVRTKKSPSKLEWPNININDALKDYDLMLIDQFKMCSDSLENGSGNLMSIRSNYGVGILPSILGAKVFVMPYDMNTLPNVRNLDNGIEDIKKIINTDYNDFTTGWGKQVFELGERIKKIFKKYPKIGKYVRVDHPDTQGPMDLCELLWGSEIFLATYDKPELLHNFLRKLTEIYKTFLDEWFKIFPVDGYHAFFGNMHKGNITVRDDSAMNLSPDLFKEFIMPYDNEVLNHFGGGCLHYCGKGDHFSPFFSKMDKLYAINLSQPSYNDMETIYKNTVDKGINIIGLQHEAVVKAFNEKRPMHGLVNKAYKVEMYTK